MQYSTYDCIIGYFSPGVLQPYLGHSLRCVIQIKLCTDCNSTAIPPLGKLLWGQEKLKKLARSQLPDSDCDYDEVSSCYRCRLCQISEISTVSTPCSGPASFINREQPVPTFLWVTPTDQPAGSCLSEYLAERLLRLHVLFCSSLNFEISEAYFSSRSRWLGGLFTEKLWIQTIGGNGLC